MKCNHPKYHHMEAEGFLTCTLCGSVVDRRPEFLNGVENYVEPIQMCVYRRSKRFTEMLRKLVYPCPEKKDDPILEKFLKRKKTFGTINEFIIALKNSGIKDKRYQSIHTFCKLFCSDYEPVRPLTSHKFDLLIRMFKDVEHRFTRLTAGIPFFNYNWLLSKILHSVNITRYDSFLKKIKCKKRNLYYEQLFNSLCTRTPIPGVLLNLKTSGGVGEHPLTNLFQNISSRLLLQETPRDSGGKNC